MSIRRQMAGWDDVRRIALALPETTQQVSRGLPQWRVKDRLFVWERPLRHLRRRAVWRYTEAGALARRRGSTAGYC